MKDEIRKLKIYYQEFHHKLIGWQITLSGFIFAALLAAEANKISSNKFACVVILIATVVFPAVFFYAVGHFGERIERLKIYLKGKDECIPADWEEAHKNCGISLLGEGTKVFVLIIVGQGLINFILALVRLFY